MSADEPGPKIVKLTPVWDWRGTLEVVVQCVGDTDATDALVRVFYKIHLVGAEPEAPELRPVISEFDIVPLLDGAATITRPFEIARDDVEFFRVELFRAVGREDHRLDTPDAPTDGEIA